MGRPLSLILNYHLYNNELSNAETSQLALTNTESIEH